MLFEGRSIGRVTAYEISPYLEGGVGFALLDSADLMSTGGLSVADRDGNDCAIELVDLPFYDAEKNIPRGLPPIDGGID